MPILEAPWRHSLRNLLPSAQLLKVYYDASGEHHRSVLHPTLLWEDPRCPPRPAPGCRAEVSPAEAAKELIQTPKPARKKRTDSEAEELIQTPVPARKKRADGEVEELIQNPVPERKKRVDSEACDDEADKETEVEEMRIAELASMLEVEAAAAREALQLAGWDMDGAVQFLFTKKDSEASSSSSSLPPRRRHELPAGPIDLYAMDDGEVMPSTDSRCSSEASPLDANEDGYVLVGIP